MFSRRKTRGTRRRTTTKNTNKKEEKSKKQEQDFSYNTSSRTKGSERAAGACSWLDTGIAMARVPEDSLKERTEHL
jgi:hypothetical protein